MSEATPEPPPHSGGSAPSYIVPPKRIVSIEHPCTVQDFNHAFTSLGGEHQLKRILEHKTHDAGEKQSLLESSAAVSFRPQDAFAQKVPSTVSPTRNILIKITVPKRTGRKRKRGSDAPFEDCPSPTTTEQIRNVTAADLLQVMRDNSGKYTVEPVGVIEDTHRFQQLPDYQVRASEVPIMREIHDHLLTPAYDNLGKFSVDLKPGWDGFRAFPGPPTFVPDSETFNWQYRHSDAAVRLKKPRKRAPNAPSAMIQHTSLSPEVDTVPQRPPFGVNDVGPRVRRTITAMKEIMEHRPIITIRAANGLLKKSTSKAISQAVHHVGYMVDKGPWRDAIVKYGIDPRKDPKYRAFQTLQLRPRQTRVINAKLKKLGHQAEPHVFNGTGLAEVLLTWQLCDLTDPLIREVLDTDDVRQQCDAEKFGWYFNGTMAKTRVILREKMKHIVNSDAMPNDYYKVLAALPNQINTYEECEPQPHKDVELSLLIRDVATEAVKGPRGDYVILNSQINGTILETNIDHDESPDEDGRDEDGLERSDEDAMSVEDEANDPAEVEDASQAVLEDDEATSDEDDEGGAEGEPTKILWTSMPCSLTVK